MTARANLTRRDFLKTCGGITFAFAVPILKVRALDAERTLSTAWVHVAADEAITIYAPAAEMGQGAMTAQALILAEELDADWDRVRIESSPADDLIYGTPIFFAYGIMLTAASISIHAYYDSLRRYGAQARRILIDSAAGTWGVPADELVTEPSVVVHPANGRRLTYGAIAAVTKAPAALPEVSEQALKAPHEFRLIGRDVRRPDIASKVDGRAQYSIDVHLPGMLHATVLHSPVRDSRPARIDDDAARTQPDVLCIVELPDGVAIVARTTYAALAAERVLKVQWSEVGAADSFDDAAALQDHGAAARDLNRSGFVVHSTGDANAALASAANTYAAEYRSDFVYHAQLEPHNAVAWVKDAGRRVEIWAGTQTPTHLLRSVAEALAIPTENVTLYRTLIGGAFGCLLEQAHRCVVDAVRLSQQLERPVKVTWSRETDLRCGRYKPISAHYLNAAEDAAGRLVAWRHRIASDEPLAQSDPYRYHAGKRYPASSAAGARSAYRIDNMLAEVVGQEIGVRLAPVRGVGAVLNAFAAESFIDEIAHAKRIDAVDLRLTLLNSHPGAQAVLRRAAAMARWRDRDVLGIAFTETLGTLLATVAEIEVDQTSGVVVVSEVWAAIDVGMPIQPDNVIAQLQGGIIFGVSNALKERITIRNGAAVQSNFHDYSVLRMSESPRIHCQVLDSNRKPCGVGEVGTVGIVAAVANAFARRTGRRIRHLPLTPERIRNALAS